MILIKKLLAVLLAATLFFTLTACGSDKDTASSEPVDSPGSEDISSEESSSASGGIVTEEYIGDGGFGGKGDGTAPDSQENQTADTSTGDNRYDDSIGYESATHDNIRFKPEKWNGPEGYVIVYQNGNESAKCAATRIQTYYKEKAGVSLSIVPDNIVKETDKEILVGKTNRSESDTSLAENTLKVSVVGQKLVFDAGHDYTLETAAKYFCRIYFESGKANTLKYTTGFTTKSPLTGYHYVWGDEFDDNDVDYSKWCFNAKMGDDGKAKIAYDKSVINVINGLLQLRAYKSGNEYKVPNSVSTETHMNYIYGYAEIKAKLPFFQGAWPSFWGQSTQTVSSKYGVYRNPNYMVEVDVFEVFGSTNNVVSNLHKWYSSGSPKSTQWQSSKKTWFGNAATLNNEYHTYGYEWTPSEMIMYVDGNKVMTYDIVTNFGKFDMKGFHDPQFLMFNNHLFNKDSNWKPANNLIENNEQMLPAVYEIEYFRLYQKNDGKSKIYLDKTINPYNR